MTASQPLRSRAGRDAVNTPADEVERVPANDASEKPQTSTQLVACSKCFRPTPETETDNGRCGQCVARDGEL